MSNIKIINEVIARVNAEEKEEYGTVSTFDKRCAEILDEIASENSHKLKRLDDSDIIDALNSLNDNLTESDFTLDFDGNEYRLIAESDIWEIYVEEIKNTVNDCYDLKLDNIPHFIAFEIDWEQTAKNAYVDGYGHTFSGYDGSELESEGFYIFRTN